jgi:hypothetical protein
MFIGTILSATLALSGQPADAMRPVVPIPSRCAVTMDSLPIVHRTMVANGSDMQSARFTFAQWEREAVRLGCVKR